MTITVRTPCACKLCETVRRLRDIRAKLPADDAAWLETFGDEFLGYESDAEYYGLIMRGEWPDAVEILTRALERAKAKQEATA